MFKKYSKTVRFFCTVTSLITVLTLTGCSCSGLGALGKLIGGGGSMGHALCCDRCGLEFPDTFSAHEWACLPTPGEESISHTYFCFMCGYEDGSAPHNMDGISCTECGYSGPLG